MSPAIPEFFWLTDAYAHPFAADPEPIPSVDEMFELALGEREESSRPTVWRHHVGRRRPSDMIPTGTAVIHLVSPRFRERLLGIGATGWSSRPVVLLGSDGEPIDGYERLVTTGRCGPTNDDGDGDNYRDTVRGVLAGWDGSDLFAPAPGAYVFVTERARDALDGLSNVEFEPLPDSAYE